MKHLSFTVPAGDLGEAGALLGAAPAGEAGAPDEEGVLLARDPDGCVAEAAPMRSPSTYPPLTHTYKHPRPQQT